MEPAPQQVKSIRNYRINNVEWRYQMPTGRLELVFPGGTIEVQIDKGLQIDHSPLNIILEVPLYAQPIQPPV